VFGWCGDHASNKEKTMLRDPEELKQQLDNTRTIVAELAAVQSKLNGDPKCWHIHGEHSCITLESNSDLGWNQYRQGNMCPPCAAYWAVSVAVNHLHDSNRRDHGVIVEQERKARTTP
jgi:hypothetical protein